MNITLAFVELRLIIILSCFIFTFIFVHFGQAESQLNDVEMPTIKDPSLRLEQIFTGIESPHGDNSPVSSMAFLGTNDILVLEKDNGKVIRIINGNMLPEPVLDLAVGNEQDRGMLGIAVMRTDRNNNNTEQSAPYVFLYFTAAKPGQDERDECRASSPYYCKKEYEPTGNFLYRYEFENDMLVNPKLLLHLPAAPGPDHNSGVVLAGPDNNVYTIVGDLLPNYDETLVTKALNLRNGTEPDGRGGILRITQDGETVLEQWNGAESGIDEGILGNTHPLNKYYAYGIRNSFGMDFDPITGKLWDTENGPGFGDEINLVEPGFNSGWMEVQGIWRPANLTNSVDILGLRPGTKLVTPNEDVLYDFSGKGSYSAPEFIWNIPTGPTALKFLDSNKLGKQYENDMFVGDFHKGNVYHFELNTNRTTLELDGTLKDRIANHPDELEQVIFAQGFGGITDIEVGPDGYLHILARSYDGKGSIYRIVPNS